MDDLPAVIHVGHADYSVVLKRMHDKYGAMHIAKHRIWVDPRQSLAQRREVLLHESLHAVAHQAGTPAILDLDDEAEEKLIRLWTPWLLMLLRDNPDLVACLTAPSVADGA